MSATIHVDSNLHIISARAEVRTLARKTGFNTMDQARISLATSSLAYILDLGGRYGGKITYRVTNNNGAEKIEVSCVAYCGNFDLDLEGQKNKELQKLRKMVDELHICCLPSNDLEVIMIKNKS